MSGTTKLVLLILGVTLPLFLGGFLAAFFVGGWLGTPLVMLGMAALTLSEYWVRPIARRFGW